MQIEYDLHLTVFDTKVVEAAFRHYIRLCKANVAKGKGRPWSTHWVALNALLKDMKQSERGHKFFSVRDAKSARKKAAYR